MAQKIEDLWPDNIAVPVLSPLAILRAQCAFLERKSGGLLRAHLSTVAGAHEVKYRLDLYGATPEPSLHRILEAAHAVAAVYPVTVSASCFLPKDELEAASALKEDNGHRKIAYTQETFLAILKEVLRSQDVQAIMQSLLAKSNEVDAEAELSAQLGSEMTGTVTPSAAAGVGDSGSGKPEE